jgi:glyoxylase-like metal-dependent hydrolase (beta-lactamase superfamily II)
LDALEQALAAHGRRIEDLGLVVITHQHMDHLGLLEIVARRSGAEVAALDVLAPYLADWSGSAAADDDFAQAIMLRHGVPEDLATVLGAVGAAFRSFGSSGTVNLPLPDGGTLGLRDRTFRILHRPGHSPSDTLLWDEEHRLIVGGDHLLKHISSNPLLSRPLTAPADPGSQRPRALVGYIASMERTREMPAELVLPGHGPLITDHAAVIDERLRMHRRRARKILSLLGDAEMSAYEIALAMWGNIAVTQAYLTISEVLGHLDLLLAEGSVSECDDGRQARFRAL